MEEFERRKREEALAEQMNARAAGVPEREESLDLAPEEHEDEGIVFFEEENTENADQQE